MIEIETKCEFCPYIFFIEHKTANQKNFKKIKRCKKDMFCDIKHHNALEYYMRINKLW